MAMTSDQFETFIVEEFGEDWEESPELAATMMDSIQSAYCEGCGTYFGDFEPDYELDGGCCPGDKVISILTMMIAYAS